MNRPPTPSIFRFLCYNMPMNEMIVPALDRALETVLYSNSDPAFVVAVSGGADSVALLKGLVLLREKKSFRLYAVHVEHGLRGTSSVQDAFFVKSLCEQLEVPLLLYLAKLEGTMHTPGIEEQARDARRLFFRKAMEATGARILLMAHHQDDQAETVLMRLLRGAGSQGLGGMHTRTPFGEGFIIRPFLSIPKQALKDALTRIGQPWREDESNQELCTLRNRLRHEVLPLLEQYQPQAAMLLRQDEELLTGLADQLRRQSVISWPGAYAIEGFRLRTMEQVVSIRALRQWVANTEPFKDGERTLSYAESQKIYDLLDADPNTEYNLPHGLKLHVGYAFVHILHQDGSPLEPAPLPEPLPLPKEACVFRFHGLPFELEPFNPQKQRVPTAHYSVVLTQDQLDAVLRTPQPGDVIEPFGAPGHKLLRRYLSGEKVDRPFRPHMPILAQDENVLWVPGLSTTQATRLNGCPSVPLWKLSLRGPLPYSFYRAE